MARPPPEKGPHRLRHVESSALLPVDVGTLKTGDVFVRQGTPCMLASVSIEAADPPAKVWVINLQTGAVWLIPESEQVHPAMDVQLTFTSGRRES